MVSTLSDIRKHSCNIFLIWEGIYPRQHILQQIQVCLASIRRYQPAARVYLFSNVLGESDCLFDETSLVRWDYETFCRDTPLEGIPPQFRSDWRAWSNLFRIICLWRWGGTYFDVDDIMVKPIPEKINNTIAACFLTEDQQIQWLPHSFVPGCYAVSNGKLRSGGCFRLGADPLTNFRPENPFLEKWMRQSCESSLSDWGQVLPTRIFAADPEFAVSHVSPIPWPDLLYHPYDGGHHPADQRYEGDRISAYQLTTKKDYQTAWDKLMNSYGFFLIKNHDYAQQLCSSERQTFLKCVVQDLWNSYGIPTIEF